MPDNTPYRRSSLFMEIGSSGIDTNSTGYVNEDFVPQLRGERLVKVMREMADNDSVVGAVLFAIEMQMRKAVLTFDPAEGDEDMSLADFANGAFDDMSRSWSETQTSILSMLPHGWAFLETVFKRRAGGGESDDASVRSAYDDNLIGWRKWELRPQDTLDHWEFDDNGGVQGMWQSAAPNFSPVFIPIQRAGLFRTTSARNNPEGRSVLRTAWRDWYYKTRIQNVEGIGIERDLAGLPVGRVPWRMLTESASEDEKTALDEMKKILRNIRRDDQEGILWPSDFDEFGNALYDLELLSSGGSRQIDTDKVITRYDQRIAMTVLADFILLGHVRVGTQALSVSKVELFVEALKAWMDLVVGVVNRHMMPRLMRINGFDERRSPVLRYSGIEPVDLTELATFISELAGAGMPLFPDEELENWLRERAHMPELTKEMLLDREDDLTDEDPDDEDRDGGSSQGQDPNAASSGEAPEEAAA